jgi:DNA-binding response OmpR family regulator
MSRILILEYEEKMTRTLARALRDEVLTSVIELYVSYLRKKLYQKGEPSCMRTVRRVGCTFEQRSLEAPEVPET